VTHNGRLVGELGPGTIVGSALLVSGACSEVDAVSTEVTRIIRWNAVALERYLGANPETRNLLRRHLARIWPPSWNAWAAVHREWGLNMWRRTRDTPAHGRVRWSYAFLTAIGMRPSCGAFAASCPCFREAKRAPPRTRRAAQSKSPVGRARDGSSFALVRIA
jgi:hypothetical protein